MMWSQLLFLAATCCIVCDADIPPKGWRPVTNEQLRAAFSRCLNGGDFDCSKGPHGPIGSWDVSNVANMERMFESGYMIKKFNGDISKWNVSSVTNTKRMFESAYSFNGDISKWDVSSVTEMDRMFYKASLFNGDISKWDVSSVTNMGGMFYFASSFNGDLSKWDMSRVEKMGWMFSYAKKFNGDISKWDVSSVTQMLNMFEYAASFNGDISKWDVSSVDSMKRIFIGAKNFTRDISKWDVSLVVINFGMFYGSGITKLCSKTWTRFAKQFGRSACEGISQGCPIDKESPACTGNCPKGQYYSGTDLGGHCVQQESCKPGQYYLTYDSKEEPLKCKDCPSGRLREKPPGPPVNLTKAEIPEGDKGVCMPHEKCGAGKYTSAPGTPTEHPKCKRCPDGRFRKDPATSSIAAEMKETVCTESTFPFRETDDHTDQQVPNAYIVLGCILLYAALAYPTYRLVQLIIRQARAHKPQSKQDAALAKQFKLPKDEPEIEACIKTLKAQERKLLRHGQWTEEDMMVITDNSNQVLRYLSRRVAKASDVRQVRIMRACLKMDVLYDFRTLYDATMSNIRAKERDGFAKYMAVARKAKEMVAKVTCPNNPNNLPDLYRSGRNVYDRFHDFVERAAKASDSGTVFRPHGERAKMKGIYRVLEKGCFKYNYSSEGVHDLDVSKVLDLVRGGIIDTRMAGLADIADYILNSQEVTVCRSKDRFTKSSDSGWTDLMLNFYLNDDDDQHVCEVQLIHFKMLSQRTTQEGHGAYNVFRAASELWHHKALVRRASSTNHETSTKAVPLDSGDDFGPTTNVLKHKTSAKVVPLDSERTMS